jgi:hypothetical protein
MSWNRFWRASATACVLGVAAAVSGCAGDGVRSQDPNEQVWGFARGVGTGVKKTVGYAAEYTGKVAAGVGGTVRDTGMNLRGKRPASMDAGAQGSGTVYASLPQTIVSGPLGEPILYTPAFTTGMAPAEVAVDRPSKIYIPEDHTLAPRFVPRLPPGVTELPASYPVEEDVEVQEKARSVPAAGTKDSGEDKQDLPD